MTSLGAGVGLTHTPPMQKVAERRQWKQKAETTSKTNEVMKQKLEKGEITQEQYKSWLDTNYGDLAKEGMGLTKNPEALAELGVLSESVKTSQKAAPATKTATVQETVKSMQQSGKYPPGTFSTGSDLLSSQQAAQESKRGVQNAVAERRKLIEQLKAAGVNVEKVPGITDMKTGERIK